MPFIENVNTYILFMKKNKKFFMISQKIQNIQIN